jgi:hypothetical protein
MGSGICAAASEFRFTGELMGDGCMISHFASVEGRGLSQNWIKVKWGKSLVGTLLIRGGQEVLFGNRERISRLCSALG